MKAKAMPGGSVLFQYETRDNDWLRDWWWVVWTGYRWKVETNVGSTDMDPTFYAFLPKNWEIL